MDKYQTVAFCAILTFAFLITYCLLSYRKPTEAKAEPVTTEIPEYIAKCTKPQIPHNCEEYTIYRITRN